MRKFLIILLMIGSQLLMLSGDYKNSADLPYMQINETKQKPKNTASEINEAVQAYFEFLQGGRSAQDRQGKGRTIVIDDIFRFTTENDRLWNRYTLFDMTGNGMPELFVWSVGWCVILSYKDGKLYRLYDAWSYETLLNNGALLYERHGGAPPHISYAYVVLDSEGNDTRFYFDKYDSNGDGKYDTFFFGSDEVTEGEWEELTKAYLSVGSDEIVWLTYSK